MAIRPPRTKPLERRSPYNGRRMTEAEYLALPEVKPYLEYVDGVVLQKPMPNVSHRRLVHFLDVELGLYIRQAGAGQAGPEQRSRLGQSPNYRLPDLSYWAPGVSDHNDSIPSLAIEVRSPDQTMGELRAKCRFYRQNGVDAAWLIDPSSRTIEVFEGKLDGVALSDAEVLTSPLLPDFELPLKQLFATLDTP
ncbi:MAG: Uma2 family endonuclease [Tepidiformaceae bacterium]